MGNYLIIATGPSKTLAYISLQSELIFRKYKPVADAKILEVVKSLEQKCLQTVNQTMAGQFNIEFFETIWGMKINSLLQDGIYQTGIYHNGRYIYGYGPSPIVSFISFISMLKYKFPEIKLTHMDHILSALNDDYQLSNILMIGDNEHTIQYLKYQNIYHIHL